MQEIMKIKDERGNPVCRRTYFRVTGTVKSPLLIGSGENQETDMDVLVDAHGKPFLPGTSLAGALKHAAEAFLTREKAEALFGRPQRSEENGCQSRVFVYDATLAQAKMSLRDGVRLDEFKTAANMAKYEMQVVEAGAAFSFCLALVEREQDAEADEDEAVNELQTLLSHLNFGDITLGAKSRRGFGRLSVDEIKIKKFSMREQAERNAWLDWDWRDEKAFDDALSVKLNAADETQWWEHCLCVPLNVKHTLLIRQYPKELSDTVDYQQIQSGENAVIPGSSWMGAIRAHIAGIMCQINPVLDVPSCQRKLGDFFGAEVEKEKSVRQASWVKVEESVICDANFLTITRNAIDRFTGGTVSGALYTAKVAVQGKTALQLRWPHDDEKDSAALCGLLLWAVRDLQTGLLAVGGETAVGRGIFSEAAEPVRLDGVEVTAEQEKEFVRAAAQWCKKAGKAE